VVYTPHGNVLEGYFGPAATWLYARMEGLASAFSDRIVSLTRLEREGYLAEGIGRPEQHRVIPSGIDLAPFAGERADRDEIRRGLGAGPGSFLVASVGRLVPIKGHPHLVEAFAEVSRRRPGSRLMLVGDGPLRAALDGRIRELGLEGGVLLTGHRDDVARLLRAADLFVLPSLNEGLGMVLVEAMASGLATVASRVGGIPEVVLDRDTGLLVPPGDPGALADAILRLADDEGERRRMGRAGRDRAFEVFSIERTVRETERLYEELADRP
jgi:glycosyltransferase involved in cell wall biosynthesis